MYFFIYLILLLSRACLAEITSEAIEKDPERYWGKDSAYSGIVTFAHLEHKRCLTDYTANYDIAILGFPYDTSVSYRNGARLGPRSIRTNSMRQQSGKAFNVPIGIDPYDNWAKIIDCGDIPLTAYDNLVALNQMNLAYASILNREPTHQTDNNRYPRIISLGGDHSILYPILKQLKHTYKRPISVIHFDSHLDTWSPVRYSGPWESDTSRFTHGSMLHLAAMDGAVANSTSVHAGLRTRLIGLGDYDHDATLGFKFIEAREIDEIGVKGIINRIKSTVGDNPCYLSIDIDVIDPSMAPGTGTPEIGGWTTREMKAILQGLSDLDLVGADLVEVSPAFDNEAEITALAAADLIHEILSIMVASEKYSNIKGYRKPEFMNRRHNNHRSGKDEL